MNVESFLTGFLAEFLAGFIGIFIGLQVEKWWSNSLEQKTIEDALPYIYVELCENLLLFEGDETHTVENSEILVSGSPSVNLIELTT